MSAQRSEVIELTRWHDIREAFRAKDLRQAGYTEGAVVMADCLLDLHGVEHRERRRLENRLFRRDIFSYWEHEVLEPTIRATLNPFVEVGRGDLAMIGYRSAMNLTAMIAGIDHDPTDADGTERLYNIVKKFSEGATLIHSTRDKEVVRAEVREAMEHFTSDFFMPSMERRREIIRQIDLGELPEADLPKDVLTTLLRNEDRLELPFEVILREISFYLQAGAHSTGNAFTHNVDDLLTWGETRPVELEAARHDVAFVQRCMHESLRLNPASPVATRTPLADVELSDGRILPEGSTVVLDLMAANRDTEIFGSDAAEFDPLRVVPDGVARWGMSFGGGMHACVGAELDGGLEILDGEPGEDHLYGTVAVMAQAFLAAGGRRDPENPPQLDPASQRSHYSTYPVVFGP